MTCIIIILVVQLICVKSHTKQIKILEDTNDGKHNLQMEVIDVQNDENLKSSFREATSLSQFYSHLSIFIFSGIRQFAQTFPVMFAST